MSRAKRLPYTVQRASEAPREFTFFRDEEGPDFTMKLRRLTFMEQAEVYRSAPSEVERFVGPNADTLGVVAGQPVRPTLAGVQLALALVYAQVCEEGEAYTLDELLCWMNVPGAAELMSAARNMVMAMEPWGDEQAPDPTSKTST
jgi:hypothetical protein